MFRETICVGTAQRPHSINTLPGSAPAGATFANRILTWVPARRVDPTAGPSLRGLLESRR